MPQRLRVVKYSETKRELREFCCSGLTATSDLFVATVIGKAGNDEPFTRVWRGDRLGAPGAPPMQNLNKVMAEVIN
jgi:hypothetical protein